MINLSDDIVIVPGAAADDLISAQVQLVYEHLARINGPIPSSRDWWDNARFAYQYFFKDSNRVPDRPLDSRFITLCLQYLDSPHDSDGKGKALSELQAYFSGPSMPAQALMKLRQGIRLLLIANWEAGVLLLPVRFRVNANLREMESGNELVHLLRSADDPKYEFAHCISPGYRGRMNVGLRHVLWTTTWTRVEDVSLYEIADLHREVIRYKRGDSGPRMTSSPIPWTMFLNLLNTAYPERVTFDVKQLSLYSEWMAARYIYKATFAEFEERPDVFRTERVEKRAASRRAEKGKHELSEKDQLEQAALTNLARVRSHEAAIEYFATYRTHSRRGIEWMRSGSIYPGREFVTVSDRSELWYMTFKEYLRYRKYTKGLEDEEPTIRALNILGDYLFLYLPWWRELYPFGLVGESVSPKSFTRYAYVQRLDEVGADKLPVTLLDLIRTRCKKPETVYAVVKQLDLYFSFVESYYAENQDIAGLQFRSPVRGKFDLPRIHKRFKTSKTVFELNAYGYLIHYVYAVEAFGEYLLMKARKGELTIPPSQCKTKRFYDTNELGCVPFVMYRGRVLPLGTVPNVFQWAYRWIVQENGQRARCFVPHLTGLRLLIGAVESGLRLQSLQWLDRTTWDSQNDGCPPDVAFGYLPAKNYTYDLVVNTDKIKPGPWITTVVYRVRNLFYREVDFQCKVLSPVDSSTVKYEGRDDSRFAPVVPLFRAANSAAPVSDSLYADQWIQLMCGFQEFYSQVVPNSNSKFLSVKPIRGKDGQIEIHEQKNGLRCCRISVRAINTPHACRATYATNRQGILESSELAELLGHSDEIDTIYYQRPHKKDLARKLERIDMAVWSPRHGEDADADYVRADKGESNLVRAFMANRSEAISTSGFIPISRLWAINEEDIKWDGLELLQTNPMSLIRFRETHICPIAEQCPAEIVKIIGAERRCGLCPLAMKAVDHLTGIAAKKNELTERIRYNRKVLARCQESGEPQAVTDSLWQIMELDTNELIGWHLNEAALLREFDRLRDSKEINERAALHVPTPEIVTKQLQRVSKKTKELEFVLHRIAQANIYKSMATPEIQATATLIRRKLMAKGDNWEDMPISTAVDDVAVVAKMLKVMLLARGLTFADVASLIETSDGRVLPQPVEKDVTI